jgi:hypothetical protein
VIRGHSSRRLLSVAGRVLIGISQQPRSVLDLPFLCLEGRDTELVTVF